MAMLVKIMELPPILTIGSVRPVTGKRFTATAIFVNAWNTTNRHNPNARKTG
tara:strand:+ start:485 stop:640 length:156 start_codon:yes stop_codon:yes gene_type:complete